MTGYGGMTPSSESGELAGYGMDTSSLGGTGGLYPQESGSYTSTSYNYQQTVQTQYTGAAGQGEALVQQPLSGQSGLTVFFVKQQDRRTFHERPLEEGQCLI